VGELVASLEISTLLSTRGRTNFYKTTSKTSHFFQWTLKSLVAGHILSKTVMVCCGEAPKPS